jgi:hypothetical protein
VEATVACWQQHSRVKHKKKQPRISPFAMMLLVLWRAKAQ